MKARIVHAVLLPLLLPCMYGCGNGNDDRFSEPAPVLLDLNIALVTRTDADGQEIPDWEKVKDLRIVLIDNTPNSGTKGQVECNNMFDVSQVTEGDGQYRYRFNTQIQSTKGNKILYALANTADWIGNDVTDGLYDCILKEAIGVVNADSRKNAQRPIPITSRKYEINLNTTKSTVTQDIVMVYAATKFEFTFINNITTETESQSDNTLEVVKWGISDVASESYLIPHIGTTAWQQLISLGEQSTCDAASATWVKDYAVPESVYSTYEYSYTPALQLPLGERVVDSNIYYLHESRYLPNASGEPGGDEQHYLLKLWVKHSKQTTTEPVLLAAEFPHLESLVRGTHVKVEAEIKGLPKEGKTDLEVRVKTWEEKDPVDGTWEEVDTPQDDDK